MRASLPQRVGGVSVGVLVAAMVGATVGACKRAPTSTDVGREGTPLSMNDAAVSAAPAAQAARAASGKATGSLGSGASVGAPDPGRVMSEADAGVALSASAVPLVSRSHHAMGTQIAVSVYTDDETRALEAMHAVFVEFDRLERLMSVWVESSDIAKINREGAKHPVVVEDEVFDVLVRARAFSEATGGKFDVSFGALSGLWRFDHDQDNRVPGAEAIKARLPLIDYRRIILDPVQHTVALGREGMRLHLGGVAKGYAVDRAVALMRNAGLSDFMIQAGGDMYASGRRGDRPWRVGVRDPRGDRTSYFAWAEVTDATFSTSGDYERFFIVDNKRYHHIIDPETGEPARLCRSVTVLAPSAIDADALSTSIFLLGPERGLQLLEKFEGAGAVIVDQENKVTVSPRLVGKVNILRSPTP